MDKLDKVIKGLECCNNDDCDNCPYFRSCDEDDLGTYRATLHRDALVLLKAQEPVKPILDSRAIEFYHCGQCNEPIDRCDNYCWSCGSAVKWK